MACFCYLPCHNKIFHTRIFTKHFCKDGEDGKAAAFQGLAHVWMASPFECFTFLGFSANACFWFLGFYGLTPFLSLNAFGVSMAKAVSMPSPFQGLAPFLSFLLRCFWFLGLSAKVCFWFHVSMAKAVSVPVAFEGCRRFKFLSLNAFGVSKFLVQGFNDQGVQRLTPVSRIHLC